MAAIGNALRRGIFVILAVAIPLAGGCSGGDDLRFATSDDESASGIWIGEFRETTGTGTLVRDAIALVSEPRSAQIVLQNNQGHFAGALNVSGDTLTARLDDYQGLRIPFRGFSGVQRLQLDGTIIEGERLFGTYSGVGKEGEFDLEYEPVYERASRLGLLAGVWTYTLAPDAGGPYVMTLDIDGLGTVFGTDTGGCLYAGLFEIIDSDFNIYGLVVDVSSCDDASGRYRGLGSLLEDALGRPDLLTLATDNGNLALNARLVRQ